jgi:citrate/tricarballylate utilization protein
MLEGERLMTICNSCRYCEGYCAVFPAMEQRREFPPADLRYLANLCHNCAECYYACQYAPPHEFAVNIPKILAEIRLQSYEHYAWPKSFARAFQRNGLTVSILLAVLVTPAFLKTKQAAGTFYDIISHATMVTLFGLAGALVFIACLIGFNRFWKDSGANVKPGAILPALRHIFTLEYLRSAGTGCTYPDEHHSHARRWFHHLTFYGFLLCFAATCVAAFYDNILGWQAPYRVLSLPVILGTTGGLGLLIGPAGLLALKRKRDRAIVDPKQDGMDVAFIALLLLTSSTGLALLALRETSWMAPMLSIHLALILILFLTLPYGKFVHGIYRAAALIRYAAERRNS